MWVKSNKKKERKKNKKERKRKKERKKKKEMCTKFGYNIYISNEYNTKLMHFTVNKINKISVEV